MKIHRFNSIGIEKASNLLNAMEWHCEDNPLQSLLDDADLTEELDGVELDTKDFQTRFEFGQYLFKVISESKLNIPEFDRGLWTWISIYYFVQLVKRTKEGWFKINHKARLIPYFDDYRLYYRHIASSSYRIYKAYENQPSIAKMLLNGTLSAPGELYEQLAAKQEYVSSEVVLSVANTLYLDPKTNRLRKGTAGKGAGSVRRYKQVLDQFDMTWDIHEMPASKLLAMLPMEFKSFK